MTPDDLKVDAQVLGLVPSGAVRIIQVRAVGDSSWQVTYRDANERLGELVFATDLIKYFLLRSAE